MKKQCNLRRTGQHGMRLAQAYICYDDDFCILVSAYRTSAIHHAMIVQLELGEVELIHRMHLLPKRKVHSSGIIDSRLVFFDEYGLIKSVFKQFRQTIWDYCDYSGDPKLYSLLQTDDALEWSRAFYLPR